MARPVTVPKLGQSEGEVTIVRWNKREGETVSRGDILFEIETDKTVLEVESYFDGTLLKILAPEGETVAVLSVVGYIGQPGETIPEAGAHPAGEAPATQPAEPTTATPPASVAAAEPTPPAAVRISPRAARLASEHGINVASIKGSGPGGRITERDVQAFLEKQCGPSGPAAAATAAQAATPAAATAAAKPGGETPVALSRMRQIIAGRMMESVATAPHFFVTVSADVTEVEVLRAEWKAAGRSYSITDFILKAVALALAEFPLVNARTDGKSVWHHAAIHLGVAVSLDDGLVVPVIRDAGQLSLKEIHERAVELTVKARAGKLTPDEMRGSTFTVTNMGMLDVENFTAIINPGESAILAVSSAQPRPVVRGGDIAVRMMMKMTLSADHRLIDGAVAARFLNAVKKRLEDASMCW